MLFIVKLTINGNDLNKPVWFNFVDKFAQIWSARSVTDVGGAAIIDNKPIAIWIVTLPESCIEETKGKLVHMN